MLVYWVERTARNTVFFLELSPPNGIRFFVPILVKAISIAAPIYYFFLNSKSSARFSATIRISFQECLQCNSFHEPYCTSSRHVAIKTEAWHMHLESTVLFTTDHSSNVKPKKMFSMESRELL